MPANRSSTASQIYKRLKKGFKEFRAMSNVHLEDALLREMGVDAVKVDLEEETKQGGPYFLPMSQERMASLDQRPDFRLHFGELSDSIWWFYDADHILTTFHDQLFQTKDETCSQAWEGTHWQEREYVSLDECCHYFDLTFSFHSGHKSTYEKLLWEPYANRFQPDPKSEFQWHIADHLVAEGLPHRSYLCIAGVPDVEGLIRSEMMVVTGMMISAMREKQNEAFTIMPVGEHIYLIPPECRL
jgi:hypothetical protein